MAPVRPGSPRPDRAQLVLIGGLLLAITFVSLTLILNSGIYTHNLATRSGSAAEEGLAVRSDIADGVGVIVEFAIDEQPDDLAGQRTNVTDAVPALREQVGRTAARAGSYANVTHAGEHNGTRIVQESDRNFTNASGTADWELAADVADLRQFRLNVTRADLVSTDASSVDGSDAFRVSLTDGSGTEWLVYVYNATGGDRTEVLTKNVGSGVEHGPCTDGTGTRTEIDLTGGTVAGDRCPALELFDRLAGDLDLAAGVTVAYDNTTDAGGSPTVAGTYELTVNQSESVVEDADFATDLGGTFPQARGAVYSVEVEFVYATAHVTYETPITVAPGEPDD